MEKVLVWNEEKKAFILANVDTCIEESDGYRLDYYGKKILWSNESFDEIFTADARLHGYACELSSQVKKIRKILESIELIREKIGTVEQDLINKKYADADKDDKPF